MPGLPSSKYPFIRSGQELRRRMYFFILSIMMLTLFERSTLKDRPIALQLQSLGHTIIDNIDIASASVTIR
jgi:hypothetical protein